MSLHHRKTRRHNKIWRKKGVKNWKIHVVFVCFFCCLRFALKFRRGKVKQLSSKSLTPLAQQCKNYSSICMNMTDDGRLYRLFVVFQGGHNRLICIGPRIYWEINGRISRRGTWISPTPRDSPVFLLFFLNASQMSSYCDKKQIGYVPRFQILIESDRRARFCFSLFLFDRSAIDN